MGKRVIAAESLDGGSPLYFAGYEDCGTTWTCRWTDKRAHALWFDALEAEVEVRLLQPYFTRQRWILSPTPLDA